MKKQLLLRSAGVAGVIFWVFGSFLLKFMHSGDLVDKILPALLLVVPWLMLLYAPFLALFIYIPKRFYTWKLPTGLSLLVIGTALLGVLLNPTKSPCPGDCGVGAAIGLFVLAGLTVFFVVLIWLQYFLYRKIRASHNI